MSRRVWSVTGVMVGLYVLWIAAGYSALTNGIDEIYESVNGGGVGSQDSNARSDRSGTKGDGGVEPLMEVGGTILLGVSSAFWAFGRLGNQVRGRGRGRGRGLCLLVLMFSFVLCAYGFGLLLELAAEGG